MWKNTTTYRSYPQKKQRGFSTSFSALKRINAQVSNLGDRAVLRDRVQRSSSCVPKIAPLSARRESILNAASCVDTYCMYIYIYMFCYTVPFKIFSKKQGSFFKWVLFKVGLTHDSGNVQRGCDNSRLICIYLHLWLEIKALANQSKSSLSSSAAAHTCLMYASVWHMWYFYYSI